VGFEPTIAMFERAKIFNALEGADAVIGEEKIMRRLIPGMFATVRFRISVLLSPTYDLKIKISETVILLVS
jgi:hypothetical protein